MKKVISALLLSLFILVASAQNATIKYLTAYAGPATNDSVFNSNPNLYYEVRGLSDQTVKREALTNAKKLSEISQGYPSNWVKDYVSTEVITKSKGKIKSAKGTNDLLTAEQKNILAASDLSSEIEINVKYKSKNAATNEPVTLDMRFTSMVVPDVEAKYLGGNKNIQKYLFDNAIKKLEEGSSKTLAPAVVRFTVNEVGETIDAHVYKTSGNEKADRVFIDAINNMPKWTPAQNSNGTKVRQDFEFVVGTSGC